MEQSCFVGLVLTSLMSIQLYHIVLSGQKKKLSFQFDDEIAFDDVSDSVLLLFGKATAKDFRLLAKFLRPNYNSLESCVADVLKTRHGHHFSWRLSLWISQGRLSSVSALSSISYLKCCLILKL